MPKELQTILKYIGGIGYCSSGGGYGTMVLVIPEAPAVSRCNKASPLRLGDSPSQSRKNLPRGSEHPSIRH